MFHRTNLESGRPEKWSKMVINGRKMVAPVFLDSRGGVTAKQQIIGNALGTGGSTRSIRPTRLTLLFWSLEVQPAVSSRVKRGTYSASDTTAIVSSPSGSGDAGSIRKTVHRDGHTLRSQKLAARPWHHNTRPARSPIWVIRSSAGGRDDGCGENHHARAAGRAATASLALLPKTGGSGRGRG